MRTETLPLADAPALARGFARARLLRAALAAAGILLLACAILLAVRRPTAAEPAAAAGLGSNTEIVMDVSGSVDSSSRIAGAALRRLARGTGRVGLILFSDSAQETLPPGTRATQLVPFARALTPPRGNTPVSAARNRQNGGPWDPSFKGGTRVSAGLAAARHALSRDRMRGSVLLISDLGDPSSDLSAVKRELIAFDHAGIRVKILALPNALRSDVRWFEKVEGPGGFDHRLPAARRPESAEASAVFPLALAGTAVLLALVLAAEQLAGQSLRWGVAR